MPNIFDLAEMLDKELDELGFNYEITDLASEKPTLRIWRPTEGEKVRLALIPGELEKVLRLWLKRGAYLKDPLKTPYFNAAAWLKVYKVLKEVFEPET